MKKMKNLRNLIGTSGIAVVLAALFLMFCSVDASASKALSITIMHVNDTHSQIEAMKNQKIKVGGDEIYDDIGGMARIASMVKKIRSEKKNTIFLHAGDAVQGTLYFTEYGGEAEFAFLNLIGVDAMTIGNHEFDRGDAHLAKMTGYAKFKVLSANIDASLEPILSGSFSSYTTLTVDGEKIGIFGLTTPSTSNISGAGKDIRFNDDIKTASEYVEKLESMGIDKIIALTHLGYERDIELARSVAGIDIIVGGHSHTLLGDDELGRLGLDPEGSYPTVVSTPDGGRVYVVQAWAKAAMLGVLDVEFDQAGKVVSANGEPVLMAGDNFGFKNGDGTIEKFDEIRSAAIKKEIESFRSVRVVSEDKEALELLKKFKGGVEELQQKVIGKAGDDLYHARVPSGRSLSGVKLPSGSIIAPHVAEAMLWKVNSNGVKNADIAMKCGGGVRKDILKGDISVADAYELLPFVNTLVIVRISGSDLKKSIQGGVTRAVAGSSHGAFPYLAGARYSLDMSDRSDPVVTGVEIKDEKGGFSPLIDSAIYRLVTDSFIAAGGDYYSIIAGLPDRYDTGFTDVEAFMDYVGYRGVLYSNVDRREPAR